MRSTFSLLILLLVTLTLTFTTTIQAHRPSTNQHVLSELESSVDVSGPAIPGDQCFSANDALEKNSEENDTLYSYESFCEQADGMTGGNEAEFRQACEGKFGVTKCRHQCRELAQLFDQTIVNLSAAKLSRGNNDGYELTPIDCVNCLRFHQCTPKNVIM